VGGGNDSESVGTAISDMGANESNERFLGLGRRGRAGSFPGDLGSDSDVDVTIESVRYFVVLDMLIIIKYIYFHKTDGLVKGHTGVIRAHQMSEKNDRVCYLSFSEFGLVPLLAFHRSAWSTPTTIEIPS
jgi:hypothetical protein